MQSTTSSSSSSQSTTSLLTSSSTSRPSQSKNYEQGFAMLSSTFGLGGFAGGQQHSRPAPPSPTRSMGATAATPVAPGTSTATTQSPAPGKNFEEAYGQLASSYGFGAYSASNGNARR